MKGFASLCLAIACLVAFLPAVALAQQPRDPLIAPAEGGRGSRFQVVGQSGWAPGETVVLRLAFASADPLAFAGPFPVQHEVRVLADGTWSFPVSVNDTLLPGGLPSTPGFIVVLAESPSKTAQNAFVFTVNGARPAGAEAIAAAGFGLAAPGAGAGLMFALFSAGTGTLLLGSGVLRRRGAGAAA